MCEVCFHCGQPLGFNETRTVIRKAVKPPKSPYRWVRLGVMCERCDGQGEACQYDEWRDDPLAPAGWERKYRIATGDKP